MRASNSFCCALCGLGMYSSLDTNCTGIGDGNSVSAPDSFSSSSGVNMTGCSSSVKDHRIPLPRLGKLCGAKSRVEEGS